MARQGRASRPLAGPEADLAARAAWLHFVGGLTQSEVAKRLELPNVRVHRYIARAQNEGLVKVFVDVEAADCALLETQLMHAYGLRMCRVAMEVPETETLPLRALSAIGGDYLMRVVESGGHQVIGIGNGRTLAASVDAMGRVPGEHIRFASVMGGLTRSYAANPYDVIHRLTQKTSAEAYLMPAPLFANSAEDKRVMMSQSALAASIELIDQATLVVLGIGAVDAEAGGASAVSIDPAEATETLRALGARAEILGQFLTAEGELLASPYDDRVMAPGLESLRGRDVVAIAGGSFKAEAIRAALKSGLLTGLIVDEATARRLVDGLEAAQAAAAE